ncbi:MAG TPA: argininosuccinate lyase [Actinophytocola sp.]|jgi:argininosuccinate lyase|nr:argininosuccinate lyase [Actinophytocola sp.]
MSELASDSMSQGGTGRLRRGVTARAARIVFAADLDTELPYLTEIDEAHLVMLTERGLVGPAPAAALLREIGALRASDYAPLRDRPAPRGTYLLYERHLIDRLGPEVGGVLHTGRSRNDLKATTHLLRARPLVDRLRRGLLRLQAVLLSRARTHRDVVMPAYSQFQPAVPATFGWYLLGVAAALDRDHAALAAVELARCPLGAAGGGGTDVPIDPARTAALLGFAAPVEHAGDAIASRDELLRLLSAAALTGVTLSRLATDLQLWSTPEYDLVEFGDELVGSSSAMPQKRNPFLLEHIKGGAGTLIGACTAALSTMKNTPFGNSVEATTEAVGPVWTGLSTLDDLVQLAICVAAGARPRPAAMLAAAERGFTAATAVANSLVRQGIPFRRAHTAVGAMITELIAEGARGFADRTAGDLAARLTAGLGTPVTLTDGDASPAAVATATDHGGGPGPASFQAGHDRLAAAWRAQVSAVLRTAEQQDVARTRREAAVSALRAGAAEPTSSGGAR